MTTIRDSVAVVTGAGSGIGRARAQELASQGAQLALADVNSAALEETRSLLGSTQARIYLVDVADASAVESFARKVEQDFGRASLLINNAGVALYGTFAEVTIPEMEWLIRINFWGVVHGCKFFMPLLQRQPQAHIVNLSSIFGLIAPPGQTAYAASKFAVRGFTQALRLELMDTEITVSCVHPAGIRTRIAEDGRAGTSTRPEGQAAARKLFNQVARITAEKAAKVIVSGILRNQPRILIGADAYQFDLLQRLFPVGCGQVIASKFKKRAAAISAAAASTTR